MINIENSHSFTILIIAWIIVFILTIGMARFTVLAHQEHKDSDDSKKN